MGGELPRMRHLVQDQPAPQVLAWKVGAASPFLDIRLDQVQTLAAHRLRAEKLRVVLAQHAPPDEREHERDVVVDAGATDLDEERVGHAPGFEHGIDGPPEDAEIQVEPADSIQRLELRQ